MSPGSEPGRSAGTWAVAIHHSDTDLQPSGAGVVIDEWRVLTCAHVVKAALRQSS
jgi:hypothetical protein